MDGIATILRKSVDLRNLSVQSYGGNGFTLWHYRASVLADVLEAGFFDAATHLRLGDHIMVSAFDGGAVLYVGNAGVKAMAMVGDE